VSNTSKLLQQVRNTVQAVCASSDNPEHQFILTGADLLLNEMLHEECPRFYLDYIAEGKALLAEGRALAEKYGSTLPAVSLRDDLSEELRNSILNAEITTVSDALTQVVQALVENRSHEEKDFLIRLSNWETSLYLRRGEQVENTTKNAKPITRELVQSYLEQKHPHWEGLEIKKFNALYGGFSKKTVLLETDDKVNGNQSLVLRVEQPVNLLCYDGSDVAKEYYMIELMHKLGIPSARPLWLEEDGGYLGGRFIVSEKAEGRVMGDSLGGEAGLPKEAIDSMLQAMYQLHTTRVDRDDPLVVKSHLKEWLHCETVTQANEHYVNVFIPNEIERVGIRLTPDLARGVKWLQENIPACDEPPALLHMDYSFNNLLFVDNKVSAILDWETSRIGDPVDEIVWTQFSLQAHLTMEEFLERYKNATGREFSRYRIAYARVIKTIMNTIGALSSQRTINELDATPIQFGYLAYKFMPLLCTQLNGMIEAAEAAKGS
jgi:aminoglycoside phosphotransferase (APT) family kinase protein